MHRPDSPRFLYRAGAFALGGSITRPFSDVLEVQASTSLPNVGGYASARADRYNYRELISFDSAYTRVTGSVRDGTHATLATATIEGLNILDIVTADRVVARLTSSAGPDDKPGDAGSFLPVGSYFVNLRIAGVPVTPVPHDTLVRSGRLSELERDFQLDESPFADPDGRRFRFSERSEIAPQAAQAEAGRAHRFEDCHVLTSMFRDVDVKSAAFDVKPGGAIDIPDFGRIILGEYLITRSSRRLTMVVCQLGCSIEGTVATGGLEGNGSGY